jgi:hypothetical protein
MNRPATVTYINSLQAAAGVPQPVPQQPAAAAGAGPDPVPAAPVAAPDTTPAQQ